MDGAGGSERPPPKESPYEPGVWVVGGTEMWKVGKRYALIKQLGAGSFGEVCLARDTRNAGLVAMKRIVDIAADSYQCRKTLREVCILRRMSHHPNICRLDDCFTVPSDRGQRKVIDGKLVSTSIDVYLVFEFADGGDLLSAEHLLTPDKTKRILTQVLNGLHFLHENGVLHRDMKSANVLMVDGVAKLCDFGCARSAAWKPPSMTSRSLSPSIPLKDLDDEPKAPDDERPRPPEPAREAAASKKKLMRSMTRTVATPCYRAPEVVMLHDGNYTFEVDVWGVGCIFAELLQRERIAYPVPLFHAITTGQVHEPQSGERYTPGSEQELDAIFSVIGTPPWRYAESLPSSVWRNYLRRIPGNPGTLMESYYESGTLAFDLLNRMLALDPERRITTEEAMCHTYFGEDAVDSKTKGSAAAGWERLRRDANSATEIERRNSSGVDVNAAVAAARTDAEKKGVDVVHQWFSIEQPSVALACLEEDLDNSAKSSATLQDHVAYMVSCLKRECEAHAFKSMGFFFGEKPRWWKSKGYECGDG